MFWGKHCKAYVLRLQGVNINDKHIEVIARLARGAR
jgi:hypothetical protein